jgi:hypothetical protein
MDIVVLSVYIQAVMVSIRLIQLYAAMGKDFAMLLTNVIALLVLFLWIAVYQPALGFGPQMNLSVLDMVFVQDLMFVSVVLEELDQIVS